MVTYKGPPAPGGYALTEHGYRAWLNEGNVGTYKEFIRIESERENLFLGIWKMVLKLNLEDLRKVYYYIRSLIR